MSPPLLRRRHSTRHRRWAAPPLSERISSPSAKPPHATLSPTTPTLLRIQLFHPVPPHATAHLPCDALDVADGRPPIVQRSGRRQARDRQSGSRRHRRQHQAQGEEEARREAARFASPQIGGGKLLPSSALNPRATLCLRPLRINLPYLRSHTRGPTRPQILVQSWIFHV